MTLNRGYVSSQRMNEASSADRYVRAQYSGATEQCYVSIESAYANSTMPRQISASSGNQLVIEDVGDNIYEVDDDGPQLEKKNRVLTRKESIYEVESEFDNDDGAGSDAATEQSKLVRRQNTYIRDPTLQREVINEEIRDPPLSSVGLLTSSQMRDKADYEVLGQKGGSGNDDAHLSAVRLLHQQQLQYDQSGYQGIKIESRNRRQDASNGNSAGEYLDILPSQAAGALGSTYESLRR